MQAMTPTCVLGEDKVTTTEFVRKIVLLSTYNGVRPERLIFPNVCASYDPCAHKGV